MLSASWPSIIGLLPVARRSRSPPPAMISPWLIGGFKSEGRRIHPVVRLRMGVQGIGGLTGLTPHCFLKDQAAHDAFYRGAGDPLTLSSRLTPHLAGPVDREVLLIEPFDLDLIHLAAETAGREFETWPRSRWARGTVVFGRSAQIPKSSLCLSMKAIISFVGGRRPGKSERPFRISLARLGSPICGSSSFMRAPFSVVVSPPPPSSGSAWRTPFLSVSAQLCRNWSDQPNGEP